MKLPCPALPAFLCCVLASVGASGQPANPPANATANSTTSVSTTAGMVKRVAGSVTLQRAGAGVAAVAGTLVHVGDTLRTGADSAVGITLADDTMLTIGADSELVLSEYSFDSTTHDGGMLASLWRGTAAVVTGLISKKTPEKVRVQTRTVVLGVRGTEFVVDAGQVAR